MLCLTWFPGSRVRQILCGDGELDSMPITRLKRRPHKSIGNRGILQLSPKRINQKHHLVMQRKVIFEANIEDIAMSNVITPIEQRRVD